MNVRDRNQDKWSKKEFAEAKIFLAIASGFFSNKRKFGGE